MKAPTLIGYLLAGMIGFAAHWGWTSRRPAGAVVPPAPSNATAAKAFGQKRPLATPPKQVESTVPSETSVLGFAEATDEFNRLLAIRPFSQRNTELYQWVNRLDPKDIPELVKLVESVKGPLRKDLIINPMLGRWAKVDPIGAMDYALTIQSPDLQAQARVEVIREWLNSDQAAVIDYIKASPNGQFKTMALQVLIPHMTRENPELALEFARTAGSGNRNTIYYPLFTTWAQHDPIAAANAVLLHVKGNERAGILDGILYNWTESDAKGALAWIRTLPDKTVKRQAMGLYLNQLNRNDPEGAAALLNEDISPQMRSSIVNSIATHWATMDLEGALNWVKSMPDGRLKDHALNGLGYQWAQTDPKAAAEYFSSLSKPSATGFLPTLAGQWAAIDPDAALEWSRSLSGNQQKQALQQVISAIAMRDPAKAAMLANQMTGHMKTDVIANVASVWAESDLQGAMNWLNGLESSTTKAGAIQRMGYALVSKDPVAAMELAYTISSGQQRANVLSSMMSQWGNEDLDSAIAYLKEVPAGREREQMFQSLSYQWAQSDPTGAYNHVMTLTEREQQNLIPNIFSSWAGDNPSAAIAQAQQMPEGPLMTTALGAAISTWAGAAPDQAAAFVASLNDENLQSIFVPSVVSQWANTDPGLAKDWVMQFPEGSTKLHVMETLASQWAQQDPVATGEWLTTLPNGQGREKAVGAFIDSITYNHPETAAQWAESLADESERNMRMENSGRQWLNEDPEAARAWINSSSLPLETKERLLQENANNPQFGGGAYHPFPHFR
ncbi:MAG: hypothetical protein SFY81_12365 [Verrucomicrobiota bacterium]|nr:hypothetical protein [Verrucomicrobiota bacterium]